MPEYRVVWEIDIGAKNAKAAANEARKIQRGRPSTATFFTVVNRKTGETVTVDVAPTCKWEGGGNG